MNEVIQELEANATNSRENFCYISENKLLAMKELSKRDYEEYKKLKQENDRLKSMLNIGKTCGFCPYYKIKEGNEKLIKYLEDKIKDTKKIVPNKQWNQDSIAYYNHNKDFTLIVYTDLLEKVKSGKYE